VPDESDLVNRAAELVVVLSVHQDDLIVIAVGREQLRQISPRAHRLGKGDRLALAALRDNLVE
jgi:hypothetical protein